MLEKSINNFRNENEETRNSISSQRGKSVTKTAIKEANASEKISNVDIAVYALYLCGGDSHQIATEDVACKCYELAPDAFSWTKYSQYPDKEIARIALIDARKSKHGCLVRGRSGVKRGRHKSVSGPVPDGWQLTEAGAKWLSENKLRLSSALECREAKSHRQKNLQKLAKIREHILFKNYVQEGSLFLPNLGAMADLFQCRVDSDKGTWEKRFARVTNLARLSEDNAMLNFIEICKDFLISKEGL